MLSGHEARTRVGSMAPTRDLVLQSYLTELTRVRALDPDQRVRDLDTMTALWAPVTVCSTSA